MKNNSKKMISIGRSLGSAALLLAASFVSGCSEDVSPTQTDASYDRYAAPVITSVSPLTESIGGVAVVTLTGTGFSSIPEHNIVSFGAKAGTVLSATETQLMVKTPNNPKDSLDVKIALYKSEKFSNSIVKYKLNAPAQETRVKNNRKYQAIALDKDGNIYAQILTGAKNDGIIKIAADGKSESVFATPANPPILSLKSLKVGPNGKLYGTMNKAILLEISEGVVVSTANCAFVKNTGGDIFDFDFDQNKYIWAGGKGIIDKIKYSDKSMTKFTYDEDVTAVRVFEDYVYIASNKGDTIHTVYRFPTTSTDPKKDREAYFEYTKLYGRGSGIKTIDFNTNGAMLVGLTNTTNLLTGQPFLLVARDKSVSDFYSEIVGDKVFTAPVYSYAGSAGEYFYYVRGTDNTTMEIIKILSQMKSAPYYGRE